MACPVVVVGGSAGALAGLLEIVSGLPADFPGAVLIALHLLPGQPSMLGEILTRAGPLPATQAQDGEALRPSHIFVAPPDHHLLLGKERLTLSRGPRENRSRPSVDVLFRSAAYTHAPRVAGVILSGMLDDGVSGLWTVKQLGGLALAQHPEEAEYPSMPLSAIQRVEVDDILPVRDIARRLADWARTLPTKKDASMDEARSDDAHADGAHFSDAERRRLETELSVAAGKSAFEAGILDHGALSPFTCPECHGAMVRLKEGGTIRFRCHTGHAYSSASLIEALRVSVEASLWEAVRVLEEDVMLLQHLAKHHDEAGQPGEAAAYRAEEHEAKARTRLIRDVALRKELGAD